MSKKHKKKRVYTISITSNISSDKTRYIRSKFNIFTVCILISILIAAVAAFATWYDYVKFGEMEAELSFLHEVVNRQQDEIVELGAANAELQSLNEILTTTVGRQQAESDEQAEVMAERAFPNGFPLTGSAEIEEPDEDNPPADPIVVFLMSDLSDVVATGDGVVTSVREDSIYGNCIVIDHGNGYVSIYKNQATPKVCEGDEVVRGAILYVGGLEDNKLGYQMTHLDVYVDPMEVIEING